MSLIKCVECGNDISDKAISCPFCGCPKEFQKQNETQFKPNICVINQREYDLSQVADIIDNAKAYLEIAVTIKKIIPEIDIVDNTNLSKIIFESKRIPPTFNTTNSPKLTQQPSCKCPTCNSSNVTKIGYIERRASIFAFGVASGKIGKTFKCNDCGYSW